MSSAGPRPAEDVTIPAVSHSEFWLLRARRGAALCLAILFLAASLSGAPEEKRIAIYSVVANYSLPVTERDGHDYVGLLEVLEPLGTVTAAQANGSRWKLRYNDVETEFTANATRARIQNRDFELASNFLLEKGRGLVPLASLSVLLPQILGGPVSFHESSRRLYIGNVAVHFTAQIGNANPPALVMSFTSPVNPRIATEPGRVQMLFTHEPLVPPGSAILTFDSKSIPSATYQENNGAAEIIVSARVPLFASFSDNGRTITLSPVAQNKAAELPSSAAVASAPVENPTTPAVQTPASPTAATSAPATQIFAVVDASHGGEERGATLSDQIVEKDVTLAFARRLRQELEAKGMPTLVLRDGDSAMSVEQRANMVNQNHPKIYICLHASSMGKGTRVYTAWLPPASGLSSGPFLNWDTAQAGFLPLSQAVAASMTKTLQDGHVTSRRLAAPLKPLNNIASAAVAIEIAPSSGDLTSINAPEYQSAIAEGIAASMVAMRERLESGQ
jgi:N-acetylmuramoyl-L-alanine amidase